MEKSGKIEVFKLGIGEKVALETVEAALKEALGEEMQKAHPEGAFGLIERVDIGEKETTVIISGNERAAKAFQNTLGSHVTSAKVAMSKASKTDIMKFE